MTHGYSPLKNRMYGKLFMVSTPIGNLEDITVRALGVLKDSDIVACEDTRTTKKLLSRNGIENTVTSYHEHNEVEKSAKLLKELKNGKNVALVSDAGTPSVSDPGWRLVNLSIQSGVDVVPVPGPSAVISALVVSGLPTDTFVFLGFLPKTAARKKRLLENIREYRHTLIFYESPRRLKRTMNVLLETLGERNVCVAREMTKLHEEAIRGTTSEVISVLSQRESLRGEVTVVVDGSREKPGAESLVKAESKLREMKERGLTLSDAVCEVSKTEGVSRNSAYDTALRVWNARRRRDLPSEQ